MLPGLLFSGTCGCAADDSGAADGGLDHGDEGAELGLEDAVKVVGTACCY